MVEQLHSDAEPSSEGRSGYFHGRRGSRSGSGPRPAGAAYSTCHCSSTPLVPRRLRDEPAPPPPSCKGKAKAPAFHRGLLLNCVVVLCLPASCGSHPRRFRRHHRRSGVPTDSPRAWHDSRVRNLKPASSTPLWRAPAPVPSPNLSFVSIVHPGCKRLRGHLVDFAAIG
jgi:hypothetical protein